MHNQDFQSFIDTIPTKYEDFKITLNEYKEKIIKETDTNKVSLLLKELDKYTHFYELKKENVSNIEERYFDYCSMEDKSIGVEDISSKLEVTTQKQYADKYTEQYSFRKYSKKGKLNTEEILQNIYRQLNGIKVDKNKLQEVLEKIALKMYEYDYETTYTNLDTKKQLLEQENSFKLMKEVKEIIDNNQSENEKNQIDLFSSNSLKKSALTNKIIRKVFFNEDDKYNKNVVEDFFTRTFDAIELLENPLDNMDNEKFIEITKESGQVISETLVEGMLNNFYVSCNTSSEIISNIEKMIGKFFNSKEAKNKNAEIVSVYLNYFRYDFKNDFEKDNPNGPINTNGTLNKNYINKKIVENSYIYTKKEKTQTEEQLKKNGKEYVEDISPMFKLSKGKLEVINEAGAGSVDSFYYSRANQRVVGTSTTIDTTGTIEKDQFIRHLYKTKKLNELVNTLKNKEDKSFIDIKEELNKSHKEGLDKVIKTQGKDNSDIYDDILDEYKETLNENGQITPKTIDKLFENNAYSFDILGPVVKEDNKVISSLNDIFLFLDYQNEKTGGRVPYTLEAIQHFHTKSKTEVKNFMIYNDLKKSYNPEEFKTFKHNIEKNIIDFVINSFNNISEEDFNKLVDKKTTKEERYNIYSSFFNNHQDKIKNIEILLKEITEKLAYKLESNVKKEYIIQNIKIENEILSLMENFTLAIYQSNNKLEKISTQYNNRFFKVTEPEERKLRQAFLQSVFYEYIVKGKPSFCLVAKQSETIDTQSETIDTLKEDNDNLKEEIEIKDYIDDEETLTDKQFKELLELKILIPNSRGATKIANKEKLILKLCEYKGIDIIKEKFPIHYKLVKEKLLREEEVHFMKLLEDNEKLELIQKIKDNIKQKGKKFNLAEFIVNFYLKGNIKNKEKIEQQINNLREKEGMVELPKEMEDCLEIEIKEILKQIKEEDITEEEEKEVIDELLKKDNIKKEVKKQTKGMFQ